MNVVKNLAIYYLHELNIVFSKSLKRIEYCPIVIFYILTITLYRILFFIKKGRYALESMRHFTNISPNISYRPNICHFVVRIVYPTNCTVDLNRLVYSFCLYIGQRITRVHCISLKKYKHQKSEPFVFPSVIHTRNPSFLSYISWMLFS